MDEHDEMDDRLGAADVAVLGLGIMGWAAAERLAGVGLSVLGWTRTPPDRTPRATTLVDDIGATSVADVIVLFLSDSDATDAVLERVDPYLRAGLTIVDMGSSEPWRSVEHAKRLKARGVGWVDAPVSGGPEGAESGTLAIMVGGDKADIAAARPVLNALGGNVTRIGGPGAGHTAKLANQAMVGTILEAVAEGLALAERAGLDPALVSEAVRGGSADTRPLRAMGPRMIARDYTPRAHVTTMLKDLRMASELGARVGVELPCVERVIELAEELVERGDGQLDISAIHRLRLP